MGTSILISNHLALNLEVSSIVQKNEYENISDFILSPIFNWYRRQQPGGGLYRGDG
jgi:hypothetical protein